MKGEWDALQVEIYQSDEGKIILDLANPDGDGITLKFHHELASLIAEGLLEKVAEVEYNIQQAVERMTQLG